MYPRGGVRTLAFLRVTVAVLVVLLGLFAVGDALRSGVSYATAALTVVVAIVAMLTLFTAPDGDRLHAQLDRIHREVQTIRKSHERPVALPPRRCEHNSLGASYAATAIAATAIALFFIFSRWRRDSRRG